MLTVRESRRRARARYAASARAGRSEGRSPLAHARAIASSGVPLEIWWNTRDRIVVDQAHQSGSLLAAIRHLNPVAPVTADVGVWRHSFEMRSTALLPVALESTRGRRHAVAAPHRVHGAQLGGG